MAGLHRIRTKEEASGIQFAKIPNYSGYMAGSDGTVWHVKKSGSMQLKVKARRDGYLSATLSSLGKAKSFAVHRLVLMAFVGMPEEGQECRHLNGVKHDNRLSNLAWGTRSENHADKKVHGTEIIGTKNHNHVLTDDQVRSARSDYESGMSYRTLASKYDVSLSSIRSAITGATWSHIGCPAKSRRLGQLSDDVVSEIRVRLSMGIKGRQIAKDMGVREDVVSLIKNNKHYKVKS